MASEPMLVDDDYASDQDSDFAPDAVAPVDDGDASDASDLDDADNDATISTSKRKRDDPTAAAAPDEGDLENSGDEAIIQKGKKKQSKARRKDVEARRDLDDEGGEGGLVKTRSMRAAEKAERKTALTVTGAVTVNVDDLWAQMTAAPILPGNKADTITDIGKENKEPASIENVEADDDAQAPSTDKGKVDAEPPAMIKIKRTYNFAGKVHTEEKMVARDSAEARLYIASLDPKSAEALALTNGGGITEAGDGEPEPQKPRKAFRSAFEPVLAEALTQRADLNLGLGARLQMRSEQAAAAKAKKLNVVEKSRMDWAGFVDKEGIKDELDLAGRSKESYASRQDFLARVESNRENDARQARLATRG